jgi:peptidoglycan/xylan/chitin deacetylase (PgdA/CDA1 family)
VRDRERTGIRRIDEHRRPDPIPQLASRSCRGRVNRRVVSARRAIEAVRKRRARILAYHSISPYRQDVWSVRPDQLQRHLLLLLEAEFTIVGLDQIVSRIVDRRPLTGLLAITFDDAYTDFVEHALPILQRLGLQATLFVPVGLVGRTSSWSRVAHEAPIMTVDQLELARDRGIAIGSHSMHHRRLPTVSDEELADEVHSSRRWLEEHLGVGRVPFAYPFGAFGSRERAAVESAGYACAVGFGGLFGNGRDTDIFELNRDPILHATDERALRARLSGWADWMDAAASLSPRLDARR